MKLISLDIETYGAHADYPPQTCFTPARSLHVDGVPTKDLVLTASITLAEPQPDATPNLASLAALVPGDTMTFRLSHARDFTALLAWLSWADTIVGMNLQFDVSYLRAADPNFAALLVPFSKTLVDLSVVSFLHSDTRPERSLKSLGTVLRTHKYNRTLKDGRFTRWDDLLQYNAEDTHNTLVDIAVLATRITHDYPDTAKLSSTSVSFFSDLAWSCLLMSEAGVPFHVPSLQTLERRLNARLSRAARYLHDSFDVTLGGPGSGKSRAAFLDRALAAADTLGEPPTPSESGMLTVTPQRGELSFCDSNRSLIAEALPAGHPLKRALRAIDIWTSSLKLLGSYVTPLLYHRANHPTDRTSVLVPQKPHALFPKTPHLVGTGLPDPSVRLSHPSWYLVPGAYKDDSGGGGGTRQSRITCKKGAHQTDPIPIQECRRSRWVGGTLVARDASQIELRVPAVLSGEPSLLETFHTGGDVHADMAVRIFGPSILENPHFRSGDTLTDPRQWGKHANFLVLYRGSPSKFQSLILWMTGKTLSMSLCEQVVRGAIAARPVLWAWQETLIEEARRRGYIEVPFTGHSRSFRGGTDYDVNEICNYPVQTWASNVVLDVQRRVHARVHRNPDIKIYLNVYDAIYADCRTPEALTLYQETFDDVVRDPDNLWHRLCNQTGRSAPLLFGSKTTTAAVPA